MRYYVWRKRYKALTKSSKVTRIFIAIIVLLSILVLAITDEPGLYGLWFPASIALPLILIELLSFPMLRHEGSIISFEDNAVTSTFRKKVRKIIPCNEIIDYGVSFASTIYHGVVLLIYISRVDLSEVNKLSAVKRGRAIYKLHMKTNNVIVVQYNDDIIDWLKTHVSNFDMNKITSGLPSWWPPTTPAGKEAAYGTRLS